MIQIIYLDSSAGSLEQYSAKKKTEREITDQRRIYGLEK